MECSACHVENAPGRRFCGGCGARLALLCPACAFANDPGDRFCGGCGLRLEPPAAPPPPSDGERREVTILFADLAGYTALSRQLDAEEVHRLLERFFTRVDGLIVGLGGTIDKHIGDCVMAVFGAPVAHDNDAERAALAALAIRDAMPELAAEAGQPLDVHVGIASGQVVAQTTGSASHQAYTVTGDTVNLAARLTAAAVAGEILISAAVQQVLPARFEREAVAALSVKGVAGPVPAWRLRRAGATAAPARPFIGRAAELEQLSGLARRCAEAGQGRTVHLRGEAGLGKTRLIEELGRALGAAGWGCHVASSLDFGTATGREPIRSLAASLLDLVAASEPTARAAAADAVIEAGGVPARCRVFLNDLLDIAQPPALRALYHAMDDAGRSHGLRETLAGLVAQRSQAQPCLLVFEDVHWADEATLDHLATLAGTVAGCRALLVLTSRPEGDPLDAAWRAGFLGQPLLTIDLAPLRPEEAAAFATDQAQAGAELIQRCIERAAGNPLFLDQLLRHVREQTDRPVPGSIQSLVQARLDALDPADKAAIQAASVFGQRFDLAGLRALLGDPAYRCDGLVQRLLVRRQDQAFLFAHALIRDGVYDTILKARRRELHLRAARWFAGRDLALQAEHLERAGDPGAAEAYRQAATQALRDYRYAQALQLAERGLACAATPELRADLACLQGELLHAQGRVQDAIAAYQAVLAGPSDELRRARALLGLVDGLRTTDQFDAAFAALDEAEALADRQGATAELARVHGLRGSLHFPRGALAECLAEQQQALALAQAAGSPELQAQALSGLADAEYARGRLMSATERFQGCVALAREHALGRIEVANLPMVAIGRLLLGDLAGALADGLTAIEAATLVGHRRAEVIARHAVFLALLQQGDAAGAKVHAEAALELARALGSGRFEAEGLGFMAAAEHLLGAGDDALEHGRAAVAICRQVGAMAYLGPLLLGILVLITEDEAERAAACDEAELLLAAGCASHNHFFFYRDGIEAGLRTGELDRVERYAAALEDYTAAEPLPWTRFVVARGRALARHGRGERSAALAQELRRLADEARQSGHLLAQIRLQAALAMRQAHAASTQAG
jgi:class 3 adenylate cyclase